MPMPVISRASSDSSTVFSVTSATRVCKFGLVPHVWAAAAVPPVSGRFVQRWRAAVVQSAVDKHYFSISSFLLLSASHAEKKRNQSEKISMSVEEVHSYSSPLQHMKKSDPRVIAYPKWSCPPAVMNCWCLILDTPKAFIATTHLILYITNDGSATERNKERKKPGKSNRDLSFHIALVYLYFSLSSWCNKVFF